MTSGEIWRSFRDCIHMFSRQHEQSVEKQKRTCRPPPRFAFRKVINGSISTIDRSQSFIISVYGAKRILFFPQSSVPIWVLWCDHAEERMQSSLYWPLNNIYPTSSPSTVYRVHSTVTSISGSTPQQSEADKRWRR